MPSSDQSDIADRKRVLANPRDEEAARRKADALGLPLQVTSYCRPGTFYIIGPPKLDRYGFGFYVAPDEKESGR